MDTNESEYVNYELCEPLGWYQKDSGWAKFEIDKDKDGVDIVLKEVTPYPEEDKYITLDDGGGSLETIEGKKTLTVWGEPWYRGFAQGYLAGPKMPQE